MPTLRLLSCLLFAATSTLSAQAAPGADVAIDAARVLPMNSIGQDAVARIVAADELPRMVTWTGRVEDERGRSLAGVTVHVLPNGRSLRAMGLLAKLRARSGGMIPGPARWFEDVPLGSLPSAVTDSHGRFSISMPFLPELDVGPLVHAGFLRPILVVAAPERGFRSQVLDVPADATPLRLGDVPLLPEARVRGRVVDEAGAPLADVRVRAIQQNTRRERPPLTDFYPAVAVPEHCETWTDAQGRFEIGRLWRGHVLLHADRPQSRRAVTEAFAVMSGEALALDDLVLRAGGVIGGTVRDAAGVPLVGADVFAAQGVLSTLQMGCLYDPFPPGADTLPAEVSRGLDDDAVHARTDAEGAFTLRGIGEGSWTVYAQAPGFEAVRDDEIAPGSADLELVLLRAASWEVTVVDVASGQALRNARLYAQRVVRPVVFLADGTCTAASYGNVPIVPRAGDSVGCWLLDGAGPIGTVIVAWAPGHEPQRLLLAGLAPGERRSVQVQLAVNSEP